jgi:hypothetical protein
MPPVLLRDRLLPPSPLLQLRDLRLRQSLVGLLEHSILNHVGTLCPKQRPLPQLLLLIRNNRPRPQPLLSKRDRALLTFLLHQLHKSLRMPRTARQQQQQLLLKKSRL